jgi:TonB family protein
MALNSIRRAVLGDDPVRQAALMFVCMLSVLAPQDAHSPARYRAGAVPAVPAMAVGGGQVILELAVNRDGQVGAISSLRTTPPFTDLVIGAVRRWRFDPAEEPVASSRPGERELRTAVDAKVLVAAVFRPPTLNVPTLGESPRDVAVASDESAFPLTISVPPFPPLAAGGGVVLLEARVNRDGEVAEATVIRSAPPFDEAARTALRAWKFRSGHWRGKPVSTFAYVLFGFPVPVSNPREVPGTARKETEVETWLLHHNLDFASVRRRGSSSSPCCSWSLRRW